MSSRLLGPALTGLLVSAAAAAHAQGIATSGLDFGALVEELPIESDLYAPALTMTGPRGATIDIYGRVNLAYQSFDDGEAVTGGIVDNGNWNSRLGFTVTNPLANGTLRYRFETGLGLRSSALVSQDFTPPTLDWQPAFLRWFEGAWESPFGTVSFGQGSSASDGTAGLDDSFTFVAGGADSSDGFGSYRFRDGSGALTDVTVGQVNSTFNGARRFRLRYDTPVFSGVMLSTSYGINILNPNDDIGYSDVALRWTGELGDFAVRSAVGYQWLDNPNGDNSSRIAGSATLTHTPTGLNLSVSLGEDVGGASYVWTRAGWRTHVFSLGATSLSVDYYSGRDFLSAGARTENYGIYAVQTIDAASIDLYAGLRRFTYSDQLGGSYRDANGVLVGMRFFF